MSKKLKCIITLGVALLCGGNAFSLFADENPVYEMQAELARKRIAENKIRVTNDLKNASLAGNKVLFYAVPAMSDIMRVPDVYPKDGRLNGELRIVAAKNEFEPASFQLYSFDNLKNVTFNVPALKGPNGAVLPQSALDLKVVKVWFQNGNAWQSYFADPGLKLVPELLLYDENMIKVDMKEVANYARLKDKENERYEWISAPNYLEPGKFNPLRKEFTDADTLQPVVLNAGEFKQFFLTVHVPENQPEGTYRGTIEVSAENGRIADIPVALRVLPFVLPLPKTYYDIEKPFVVSFMGTSHLSGMTTRLSGDKEAALKLYRKYMIKQRNHGLLHPDTDHTEESFALIKELGFETKPLFGKNFLPWFGKNFGGRLTFDNYMTAKNSARLTSEYYKKHFGHNDLLLSYGDEQGAAFVATHRNFHRYFIEYGMKLGCAGHGQLMYKGGYVYGVHPLGGYPDDKDRIRPWNELGDRYVGFYAGQHTGAENPQFIRRQHGLLGYLSNLSMVYNYEFATGSWNDRATNLYRPMVVAYLNHGGLVDTLQYEGFREGIDDMRYATKLKQLIKEAEASGNVGRKVEAGKASQYLALLKGDEMDLEQVRAEIIEYILKLISMKDGE